MNRGKQIALPDTVKACKCTNFPFFVDQFTGNEKDDFHKDLHEAKWTMPYAILPVQQYIACDGRNWKGLSQ